METEREKKGVSLRIPAFWVRELSLPFSSYWNQIISKGYTHDLNGNMTSDGVLGFELDAANRLTGGRKGVRAKY